MKSGSPLSIFLEATFPEASRTVEFGDADAHAWGSSVCGVAGVGTHPWGPSSDQQGKGGWFKFKIVWSSEDSLRKRHFSEHIQEEAGEATQVSGWSAFHAEGAASAKR